MEERGNIVACLLLRLWLMDFSHRDDRDEGKPSFPSLFECAIESKTEELALK